MLNGASVRLRTDKRQADSSVSAQELPAATALIDPGVAWGVGRDPEGRERRWTATRQGDCDIGSPAPCAQHRPVPAFLSIVLFRTDAYIRALRLLRPQCWCVRTAVVTVSSR